MADEKGSAEQSKTAKDESAPALSTAQAAQFLGISEQQLDSLRQQGAIPAQRVGLRGWRYRAVNLKAYAERAAAEADQKPSASPLDEFIKMMAAMGPPPKDEDESKKETDESPVVRMANAILVTAIEYGASDIHFEPDRANVRIRVRIDGAMQQLMTFPKHIQRAIADRYKVMTDIPLDERDKPHQGFIPIRHNQSNYNLRVSVVPSLYGEDFVFHILRQNEFRLFNDLGFAPDMQTVLDQMAFYTRGLLLIAGPSGSGRTTTANVILQRLNSVKSKICAYEESQELPLGGIINTYRQKSKNWTPAEAVSALLRHDPDILFLGDLGGSAIAKAAVDAAQTGILVIATITARDSVDALLRLVGWGIAPGDVANAVTGIVAQYLLPKICTDCGGEGCDACRKTGRKGRIGVFEIRGMYDNERDALSGKTPIAELRNLPIGRYMGQTELLDDARAKAEQGIIMTDEVNRLASILPK